VSEQDRLQAENAELRAQLQEAEETLSAIRGGEVDALVVGTQIYTLESADASSNRLRKDVLAQMEDAVVACDHAGHVIYLNPAAEARYGTSSSAALGRVWGSPYPDATSGALLIACSQAFSSTQSGLGGVAALHVRLEDVLGALRVTDVDGYRSAALVDEAGDVVLSEQTREVKLGAGLHQNRALERRLFEVPEVRQAIARGEREGRVHAEARLTVFQRLETAPWLLAVSVDSEPYGMR